jgi:hypothetical protein
MFEEARVKAGYNILETLKMSSFEAKVNLEGDFLY